MHSAKSFKGKLRQQSQKIPFGCSIGSGSSQLNRNYTLLWSVRHHINWISEQKQKTCITGFGGSVITSQHTQWKIISVSSMDVLRAEDMRQVKMVLFEGNCVPMRGQPARREAHCLLRLVVTQTSSWKTIISQKSFWKWCANYYIPSALYTSHSWTVGAPDSYLRKLVGSLNSAISTIGPST